MTTTKRKALHGRTKDCLDYITNKDKTQNGMLVSGINCNSDFAYEEMCMINRLYGNAGNRVGYHIFQNFNYLDDITPEKAHEIGIQMIKELYPDYQCVIATHVDKAHIHNHICMNSINIKTGHKLIDKLNHPEGIAHLREVSDRISRENGLTVIEKAPPIGKYKNKNFLQHYANKNWRKQIQIDIDSLIDQAENFDHLLELMASLGYRIKKGKYIKIKPIGSEKYFKLSRIQNGKYSEDNLRKRIYCNYQIRLHDQSKTKHVSIKSLRMYNQKKINSLKKQLMIRQGKYESLIEKQESIIQDQHLEYSQYQKRIYKAKIELNQMQDILSVLNKEEICNYEDLFVKISEREDIQKELTLKIEDKKAVNYRYQELLPVLKIFTELYSLNELINEENIINKYAMKHTYQNELRMFIEAKNEINQYFDIESLDDAKKLMVESNKIKRDYLKLITEERVNIRKLNALYGLKNFIMERDIEKENKTLIRGFSIAKEMIDEKRSNDQEYCVRLPYTQKYIYIAKKQTSWIKYDERLQLFFIEEQMFKIYDSHNQEIGDKESTEICNEYESQKKYYKSIDTLEKENRV